MCRSINIHSTLGHKLALKRQTILLLVFQHLLNVLFVISQCYSGTITDSGDDEILVDVTTSITTSVGSHHINKYTHSHQYKQLTCTQRAM